MPRDVLIEFRRDTAANWTAANPTLAAGEPGYETNTGKLKIGDGATAWNALGYIGAGAGASPLTTKGDLWGFDVTNDRIPVGSDGQVLTADSAQALGLKWATPSGASAVIDLVQRSTDLVVTAASAATAQAWITGSSVAYDGSTRVLVEIQCPIANADAANELICNIWEDATDLGRVANVDSGGPVTAAVIRTPAAGAHVYTAKVWKGSGAGRQFSSGAGSASGVLVNSFLRVTRS
jgi:hypothetical protein